MRGVDIGRLRTASLDLAEVVADPGRWPDILDEIAQATGGQVCRAYCLSSIDSGLPAPVGTFSSCSPNRWTCRTATARLQ
jgi:hypothetical protein